MEEVDFLKFCSFLDQSNISSIFDDLLSEVPLDSINIQKVNSLHNYTIEFNVSREQFVSIDMDKAIENMMFFCQSYKSKNYLKYVLIKYVYPQIIFWGILSNLISFYTMIKVHMKRSYELFPICLAILCLSDCAILVLDCLRQILEFYNFTLMPISVYSCKLIFFVCYLFYSFSSYIHVFISISRWYAIKSPIKYKQKLLKTKKRRIGLIFTVCLMINTPFLVFSTSQKSFGQTDPNGEKILLNVKCEILQDLYRQLMFMDAFLFYFIPFILIFIFSVLTLAKFVFKEYQFKKNLKFKIELHKITFNSSNNSELTLATSFLKKRTKSTFTASLSLMSLPLFYLITTAPLIVTFCLQFYSNYYNKSYNYNSAFYFCKSLSYLNNSINVLVFILAGTNMRTELFQILKK